MSFREKAAWISLLSMSGIYTSYFWSVVHSGSWRGSVPFGPLLMTVIALVVVQVTLIIVVAAFAPKDAGAPPDERERIIELRATRFAYTVLTASIACACFFGAFDPPMIFNANALLFLLVMAEILHSASRIVQYRRGA